MSNQQIFVPYTPCRPLPPKNCKVIYSSQALRYRRKFTDDNFLNKQLTTLRENLLRRGCDIRDINNEFQKITNLTQKDILYRNKSNKHTHNVLPLIITFDRTNKITGPILEKHWGIIQDDPNFNKSGPNHPS